MLNSSYERLLLCPWVDRSDIHSFRIPSGTQTALSSLRTFFFQFFNSSTRPFQLYLCFVMVGWWVELKKYECIAWHRESLFRGCVGCWLGPERLPMRALPPSGSLPPPRLWTTVAETTMLPPSPWSTPSSSTASTRSLRVGAWQAKMVPNFSPSPHQHIWSNPKVFAAQSTGGPIFLSPSSSPGLGRWSTQQAYKNPTQNFRHFSLFFSFGPPPIWAISPIGIGNGIGIGFSWSWLGSFRLWCSVKVSLRDDLQGGLFQNTPK